MGADMHVLIVEDDDEIRRLVSEVLADEGYGVCEASHGRQAMDLLESGAARPSLILLDMMMPVMDGAEVLDQLAASERFRGIPVVVTTAAPNKAVGCVYAAIVEKPYEVSTLLEVIRRYEGAPAAG